MMKPLFLALATLTLAAPIAVAPAMAQTAPNWAKAQPIYITMTKTGFTPRRVVLRRGAPYILYVTNRSDKGHNLTQEAFFRSARVRSGERGWTRKGQIVLAPGERTKILFQAPMTRPGGTYQFSSTVLGDSGMEYKGWFVMR